MHSTRNWAVIQKIGSVWPELAVAVILLLCSNKCVGREASPMRAVRWGGEAGSVVGEYTRKDDEGIVERGDEDEHEVENLDITREMHVKCYAIYFVSTTLV